MRVIDKINLGIKEGLNIVVNEFLKRLSVTMILKNENMNKKPAFGLLARPKRDKMLRKRLHYHGRNAT